MKYPIPTKCNYCGSDVNLISNSEVYGKEYGNGKCYKCTNCDAYVGVHPDLITPLGRLANKELRGLKKKAHSMFDPLWRSRKMTRNQAYSKMAKQLNIPVSECHFGWFDREMLLKAIFILNDRRS